MVMIQIENIVCRFCFDLYELPFYDDTDTDREEGADC